MALWWNRPIWLLAILLMIPILWPELLLRWRFKNQSLEALSGHSPRSSNGLRKLSRLRAIAVCAAILSLAGTGILIPTKNRQVVALVDVSASISPAQVEVSRGALLELLGRFNPGDRVAVIAFAGEPETIASFETPARLSMMLKTAALKAPRTGATNLEAAIRLGSRMLSEKGGNRCMILLSDGRPTVGGMDLPAMVRESDIPIYVLGVGTSGSSLITRELRVPEVIHPQERVLVRWEVESDRVQNVIATILMDNRTVGREPVKLAAGRNTVLLPVQVKDPGIHRLDIRISDTAGKVLNQADSASLLNVTGPARVLVIHGDSPNSPITRALQTQGMQLTEEGVAGLPENANGLAGYGAVVLDNIPALYLSQGQQDALQGYTAGGGGLLVVGGDASLGRGEYYATGLEDLLPVQTDTRQRLFFSRANILFVIDHSGSMSEMVGKTSKQMAAMQGVAAAIEELNPQDRVGILTFDVEPTWVLRFTPAGQKNQIRRSLSRIGQGGGTDMSTAMEEVVKGFSSVGPVRRHVVILSDGQTTNADFNKICRKLKNLGVTITTIGIGEEVNETLLKDLARWGDGRYYRAQLDQIPTVIRKETVRVTRDQIQEGMFYPKIKTAAPFLEVTAWNRFPVKGYLITKPKSMATVFLEIGKQDPLLASWRYGNGRVAVFTSDSGGRWLSSWSGRPNFNQLWSQTIRSIERAAMDTGLRVTARAEAAAAVITVEAVGADGRLRPGLQLTGAALDDPPSGATNAGTANITGDNLVFTETAPGHYEARVPLSGSGLKQFQVREAQSGEWSIGWLWNPPGQEKLSTGPDRSFLGNIAAAAGGSLLTAANPVLPLPGWAWEKVPLQNWLILAALVCFLVELCIRSTSLGQMTMARAVFASWWEAQRRIISTIRGSRTEQEEREKQSRDNIYEAYRYLAERARRQREEDQKNAQIH